MNILRVGSKLYAYVNEPTFDCMIYFGSEWAINRLKWAINSLKLKTSAVVAFVLVPYCMGPTVLGHTE